MFNIQVPVRSSQEITEEIVNELLDILFSCQYQVFILTSNCLEQETCMDMLIEFTRTIWTDDATERYYSSRIVEWILFVYSHKDDEYVSNNFFAFLKDSYYQMKSYSVYPTSEGNHIHMKHNYFTEEETISILKYRKENLEKLTTRLLEKKFRQQRTKRTHFTKKEWQYLLSVFVFIIFLEFFIFLCNRQLVISALKAA